MANSCLLIIVNEHAKSKKIAISRAKTQLRRDRGARAAVKALPKWRLQPESIMRVQIIINSKDIS